MGNLFLKEREKWRLWFALGALGAFASFMIIQSIPPSETNSFKLFVSALPALLLGALICWWMQFSKRFEFWRAFKVLSVVLICASFPVLMLAKLSLEMNQALWIVPVIGHMLFVVVLTILGAWIAKRPKQYY